MEEEEKALHSSQYLGLLREKEKHILNGSIRSVNKLYASSLLVASGTTLDKIGLGSTSSLDKKSDDFFLCFFLSLTHSKSSKILQKFKNQKIKKRF